MRKMPNYYVNTDGEHLITILLKNGEALEELNIPNPEYWKFVECNILEYYLARFLGINEKAGIKNEFRWFKKVWLKR